MATDSQSEEPPPDAARDDDSLHPFHGIQSPGICFTSGHSLLPHKYLSTPTSIGSFDEVWIVTPDKERLLYTDPPEAGSYTVTYHDFDQIVGAAITWEHANEDHVALHLDGEDGTILDLRADLGVSPKTEYSIQSCPLRPNPFFRRQSGRPSAL